MKFTIFYLLFFINFSSGFEILGVLPYDSNSHFKIGITIMKSLAEFFHNVTVISPRPQKQELHFFRDISITEGEYEYEGLIESNYKFLV